MANEVEFFGDPAQQALSRRIDALWTLLADDPRFHNHGRGVGLNYDDGADVEGLGAVATLLGSAALEGIPADEADAYAAGLSSIGFKALRFDLWQTGPAALDHAEQVILNTPLPADLQVSIVDETTPSPFLHAVAAMTEACGITLRMGGFVRGTRVPAVFIVARDSDGRPVGMAASVAAYHGTSRYGSNAFWGMLATSPDRRREQIAIGLGARAMREMYHRHGYASFVTGIERGYAPSETLCAKLGLARTDKAVVVALDPEAFP